MNKDTYKIMAENQNSFWWNVARCEILKKHIEDLNLKSNAKILEIGCGSGANLAMLKSLFQDINACEFDEFARNYAAETFGVEVKKVELPGYIPYEKEQFDLILLCDVLEHIENHKKALEAIKSKLKPGGYLLITVPAHPFLWSYADEIAHHFRRYTKTTLQNVVNESSGYIDVYERYFMQILFPAAILVRLIKNFLYKKDAQNKTNIAKYYDIQKSNGFINLVLKKIFLIEKYLIIRNLPGLSILKIIRRND